MKNEKEIRLKPYMANRGVKVREPNTLIEASHKLNREEQIIWLWTMLKATISGKKTLTPEDIEEIKKSEKVPILVGEVDLNELRELFPDYFTERKIHYYRELLQKMEKKVAYEVKLEDYLQNLKDLGFDYLIEKLNIPVPTEKRKVRYFGISVIFSMALVEEDDKKKVLITYSPYVAPFLLDLKSRYTTYDFLQILELKSKYSISLYKLIKEHLGLKHNWFYIDFDELQKILNTKYKEWRDFKKQILKPAIKEINEKTNLEISYKTIRGSNRRVSRILFKVNEKIFLPKHLILPREELQKLLTDLVKSFQKAGENITLEEFAEVLLSLERVNPVTAIWFLLHYPEGEPRLYAWEHIQLTENSTRIKHPDKFLESLIKDKNPELDWLLDQRTKDLIKEELKKIAREKIKEREELENLERELYELQPLLRLYEDKLAEIFNVPNPIAYVNELLEKGDLNALKEVINALKKLSKERKTDDFEDFY
jgi:hypothetical protein